MVRPTRRSLTSCSARTPPSWRSSTSAWRSPRVTKRRKQTTVGTRREGQTEWATSTKERESSGNGRVAKSRSGSWKSRRRGRTRRERRAGARQRPTRRLPPYPAGCGAVGGQPVTETGAPIFEAMASALTTDCASRNQARSASGSREGITSSRYAGIPSRERRSNSLMTWTPASAMKRSGGRRLSLRSRGKPLRSTWAPTGVAAA